MTCFRTFERRGLRQIVGCCDIVAPDSLPEIRKAMPECVAVVYSDPPWNPGNEKYWRNHASASETKGYVTFLRAWHSVVAECCHRGARDVLTEQSSNDTHRAMLVENRHGWELPLLNEWTVFYGSPGSASVKRPNVLMHFGIRHLSTDPTGMAGEPMTTRVCAGLGLVPETWIVDPCTGKGMTSRQAHYFGLNFFGTEINAARLQKTIDWLKGQGYTET